MITNIQVQICRTDTEDVVRIWIEYHLLLIKVTTYKSMSFSYLNSFIHSIQYYK